MARIFRRKFLAASVLDKTLDRINLLYDRFDKVVVSFSGGKDSTVCLNLAMQVARERRRLPLDVYTFDEEVIHPETVEYLQRIACHPDIRFRWYCVPVRHRNACSRRQPYWHPWDPADRHLWVRALTDGMVPVVVIEADPMHRMMSTIRHNRARGQHAVLRMAEIVRAMIDAGLQPADVCRRLGMEDEELERLLDRSGMTVRGSAGARSFGRAWEPSRNPQT